MTNLAYLQPKTLLSTQFCDFAVVVLTRCYKLSSFFINIYELHKQSFVVNCL